MINCDKEEEEEKNTLNKIKSNLDLFQTIAIILMIFGPNLIATQNLLTDKLNVYYIDSPILHVYVYHIWLPLDESVIQTCFE